MPYTKMKLSKENVKHVLTTCLQIQSAPESGTESTETVVVQGIANNFVFNKHMLLQEEKHIEELLSDLPEDFKQGSSFMQMYTNREGEQWTGVIQPLEELLALGVAVGKIHYLVPREQWWSLSGGMPYIAVK